MKLEWMGKYREFVGNMVKFGNYYADTYQREDNFGTEVSFTPSQIQTLEYILENEDKIQNMTEIAAKLGISNSAFSKNVKRMIDKGLLEKYHVNGNRKNIIVRASALGRKVYEEYAQTTKENLFRHVFAYLDEIPDEYVAKFTQMLDFWCTWPQTSWNKEEKESIKWTRIE